MAGYIGSKAVLLSTTAATVTGDMTVDTSTLKVDSTNNRVGLGIASPTAQLHIFGDDTSNQVIIENTATSASSAPDLMLLRTSTSSAADNDVIGRIDFAGLNDANEQINYFTISARIDDASDGSENGMLRLQHIKDGSYVEPVVIDGSGKVIIGHDSATFNNDAKIVLAPNSDSNFTNNGQVLSLNRSSTDGDIVGFYQDASAIGSIKARSGTDNIAINSTSSGRLSIDGTETYGWNASAIWPDADNAKDLGSSGNRWDDVYATNSTINTSDENEKQNIASFTTKELAVATKLSALFKTFKWKDKVTEKADKARTHSGIVAQQVKTTFASEGLDATNYGLFISTTWTDDDGKEQTRMGVRYPELFSFIFGSIEARLTALEAK